MKKIILINILLLSAVSLFSQLSQLPTFKKIPIYNLDRSIIKEIITEAPPASFPKDIFSNGRFEVDSLVFLRYMDISATSVIQNDYYVTYGVEIEDILLLDPSKINNDLYIWSVKSDYIRPMTNIGARSITWRVLSALDKAKNNKDKLKMFVVSLFPDEKYDLKYLAYKMSNDENMFFIDEKLNTFTSLEELLQYYFGGTPSYIEAYNFRKNWKAKQEAIRQSKKKSE